MTRLQRIRADVPDLKAAVRQNYDAIASRYENNQTSYQTAETIDLEYIERRSVMRDVRILLRTPIVMLFRQGSQ